MIRQAMTAITLETTLTIEELHKELKVHRLKKFDRGSKDD